MNRKELIVTTARKVIVTHGLYDASIGRIAKEAGIPVGSVYTYFDSKEELINYIFREIKVEMGGYIFRPVEDTLSIKEELKIYWQRAVTFALDHQEKFLFAEQFANSPLISPTNREQIEQEFRRVFFLLQLGVKERLFKNLDVFLLHSIIYSNITGIIKFFSQYNSALDELIADQLFECCWDSIKI